MGYTARVTERSAIVAWLAPASRNAGTNDTDIIDMKLIRRLVFDLIVGAITGAGTVQLTIYGNTASSVSSPAPVALTGKLFTASTFSGSDASARIGRIEITSEEVEAQGLRYVFGRLVGATAAAITAVVATAYDTSYGDAPGTIPDLTAVAEIVY